MNGISGRVASALSAASGTRGGQSIASNQFGSCVVLTDMHQLEWCDLRSSDMREMRALLVEDPSGVDGYGSGSGSGGASQTFTFKEQRYTNVSFNADGNMLLCWNESSVGIVAIPQACMPDGVLDAEACESHVCPFSTLAAEHISSRSGNGANGSMRDSPAGRRSSAVGVGAVCVVQAAFHSLSPFHVVILLSDDSLLLTDALSDISQQIFLQHSSGEAGGSGASPATKAGSSSNTGARDRDPFVRFCFGSNYDWMKLTLFLVTSRGMVFYLCPLLPTGAIIPTAVVESLYAWVEGEYAPLRSKMKTMILNYLRVVFGSSKAQAGGKGAFVEAGDATAVDWAKIHSASASTAGKDVPPAAATVPVPCLQGPMRVYRSRQGASSSGNKDKSHQSDEIELNQSDAVALHRRGVRACDICSPQNAHRGSREAPVLAIAYEDGCVDLLLPSPACISSFVSPLWLDYNLDFDSWRKLVPDLVLVEEVRLRGPGCAAAQLRLTADPVFSHFLHATEVHHTWAVGAADKTESHLLAIGWLRDMLDEVDLGQGREPDAHGHSSGIKLEATQVVPVLTGSGSVSAISIISDAMVGHIALFRAVGGDRGEAKVHFQNITTIKRAFDYAVTRGSSLSQGVAKKDAAVDEGLGAFQSKARSLIAKVQAGLDAVPHADSAHGTEVDESTRKKQLLAAAQHIKEGVVAPLEDLAYRTVATMDGLRDAYADQVELLESPKGLKAQLGKFSQQKNAELSDRVAAIGTRLHEQRARASRLVSEYTSAVRSSAGATAGEAEYRSQLEQWSRTIVLYKSQLAQLSALVKVATGEVLIQPDGELSARSSLVQGAGARGLDSPFSSGASFSSASPVHTPHSAQSNKSGANGGAGGTVGAAGGADKTPFRSTALFQSPPRKSLSSVAASGGSARNVGASRFGLDTPTQQPGTAGNTPVKTSGSSMTPLQARRHAGLNRTPASAVSKSNSNLLTHTPTGLAHGAVPGSGSSTGSRQQYNNLSIATARAEVPVPASLTDEEIDHCTKILLGQDKIIAEASDKVKVLEAQLIELAFAQAQTRADQNRR